ncbi:hypothetical protein [Flavobacterium luminosum]|uniref:Uncharacterized protein n=1 Tax=Flavobacterium luminosum TaxID=2949086 RepID=A0ABT0TM63_9FLAO|nr:hypothetical protein [Flavobacterium sp. HXWNR70]MCL9808396.1 hypothetical protein [Flavobacterium sp. HXWNR70]
MRTYFFRLGFLSLLILSSSSLFSKTIADSTVVFEDDKIYILDFGGGSIDLRYKNGYKAKDLNYKYQIRLFYDNPIFLGSEKKETVEKKGVENVKKSYLAPALKYQKENFFNDLDIEPSQIKIITKEENNIMHFYYLRAHRVNECKDGISSYFWCNEEVKEKFYAEVNINDEEIYFKEFKTKPDRF